MHHDEDFVGLGRAVDHVLDEILDLVCWIHDEVHVDLECVIDHVLDEILAYWFICDGVALLVRWELFRGACIQPSVLPEGILRNCSVWVRAKNSLKGFAHRRLQADSTS